ncbi:MAG TPA: ABC transporter permease [Nitrospiraceae bacterium]|nr:ABC transporter permease [Nitrospiraceae bacterium]
MTHRAPWLGFAAGVTLSFLYLPIGLLMLFSFNAARLSSRWQGVTWEWYRLLLADQALLAAAFNSLLVAVLSTALALVLGVTGALGLERLSRRYQSAVEGALLLPLIIPEIMMGVALMLLFVMIRMPLSLTTVVIGHVVFNLPLVIIIVRARLQKLDPKLVEAAQDLGAGTWQVFRRVTEPLIRPAVIGAGLMALTVSLDDFIVTFFLAGPGATTLPLKVYSMIKAGLSPEINALSAVIVVASMGLIAVSLLVQRRPFA